MKFEVLGGTSMCRLKRNLSLTGSEIGRKISPEFYEVCLGDFKIVNGAYNGNIPDTSKRVGVSAMTGFTRESYW